MEINKSILPALAMTLALSGGYTTTLNASDLNYNFLEGEFLIADSDDELERDDTFGLAWSYKIQDQIFIEGGYYTGSGTGKEKIEEQNIEFEADVDVDNLYIGAGYIYPINTNWDANLMIGFSKTEFDGGATIRGIRIDVSGDDSGMYLSGGVRGMFMPKVEVSAFLDYSNADDSSDILVTLSGQYYLMENISAGISSEIDSDGTSFLASARLYF